MTRVHSDAAGVSVPSETEATNVADILAAAADLIEPKGRWTQGQCARGEEESWPNPESPAATCWCGVGAVMAVTYRDFGPFSPLEGDAIALLHKHAHDLGFSSFASFNDAAGRTPAEVVAALRATADKARTGNAVGAEGVSPECAQ